MGSKPATTREAILGRAYECAREQGLAALGIRGLARECGVATGTIYNYFPDMASLRTEVVQRFWESAIEGAALEPRLREGDTALDYCRRLYDGLSSSLAGFRASWLKEVSGIDGRTRERTRRAMRECLETVCGMIRQAIEDDTAISAEARSRLDPDALARLIWSAMYSSMRDATDSCDVLLEALELALYRRGVV